VSVPTRQRATLDTVAGLLAAAAAFSSLIAIAYRPIRIGPAAILIALVAAGIGGRHQRLAGIALAVAGVAWIVGMILAVVTENPLW
jgi:hypothetical protein